MQRIGYFSTRGYWHAPLAVFIGIVVGGVALPLGQSLGIGLIGFGVACSLIIAFVLSIQATLNQTLGEIPGAQRVGSSHWPRPRIHRRSKGNDEECRLRICRGIILGLVMAARRLNWSRRQSANCGR
jgi:hypothetical protein